MHELSIALSLVDLAAGGGRPAGRPRVRACTCGSARSPASCPEALLASYEMACVETPLEGSRLVIEEVPVVVFCPHCRAERAAGQRAVVLLPRVRHARRRRWSSGRELELVALEIEQ